MNNKQEKKTKHFYEVTVCETFVRSFRVKAEDELQATAIIEEAANADELNCDEGDFDYSREITEITPVRKNEYLNTRESEGYYEKVKQEEL